jgi:hypothetical protein
MAPTGVVADTAIVGSSAAKGFSLGGPIGGAVGALKGAVQATINELLQHSLRLKNAKSENAAIPPVVAAYDGDLQAIVNAYNNGDASPQTCIAALQQLDANIYNQLRSGTLTAGGAPIPGTAWDDATGFAGKCNKQCTAGCCVYFGDLGPPLSLAQIAMGGQGGRWGTNDPRWKGNGVIEVPEVFASKYGGQDRPKYTITISAPPIGAQVSTSLKNTINSLLGLAPTTPTDPLGEIISGTSGTAPLGTQGGPLGFSSSPGGLNLTYLVIGGFGLGFLLLLALVMRK